MPPNHPMIKVYLDCVSPYSYFAFTHLANHRSTLHAHNIALEFVPIFLPGVLAGTGNQPPWVLPAKAAYMDQDLEHAKRWFGLPEVKKPTVFPMMTLKPQRALVYVRKHFPETTFLEAFRLLWVAIWERDVDVSQDAHLSAVWRELFTHDDLAKVLAAADSQECKRVLKDNTAEAVSEGAFGAPWFVVRNRSGEVAKFFGSDRFQFMGKFLGVELGEVVVVASAML